MIREEQTIYAGLNEIFRDFLADDTIDLKPETTADDVEGWDSSTHINIILAAEERFGVRMTSKEIEGLKSVGALVDMIKSKNPKL
jgi:acyl carrier protein